MLDLATLAALHEKYREAAALPVADFALGPHRFDFQKQAYLMGVVNLSADSWYRESVALSAEAAIRRGRVLHEQGAAIIDVGAESTLAHAAQVDGRRRRARWFPVVRELAAAGICVSVETYHPSVTTACLKAGAKVLNLTGTTACEEIFREVADFDAGVIICFVQGDNVREVGDLDLGAIRWRALRIFRAADRGGDERGRVAHLDRSGPRFLLPEFAGQRRAHPAPDAGFPQQLSPARARLAGVPGVAARLRVLRGRGARGGAVLCRAGAAGSGEPFAHARNRQGARRRASCSPRRSGG
jgi:hypothetical protein